MKRVGWILGSGLAGLGLALALAGCDIINSAKDTFKNATATAEDLEASTGVKPAVGFDWTNGRLVQANDGNFYGTSQFGGVKLGGTAFKLTPAGQLSIIFPFDISPSDPERRSSRRSRPAGSGGVLDGRRGAWLRARRAALSHR